MGAVALALMACAAGRARADVLFTLDTDSKGNSATALISAVEGGIQIHVTNTISNTADAANAISQFSFTVAGLPTFAPPSAFTEIKGKTTDFAGTTANVDDKTSTNVVDHWGFYPNSNKINEYDVNGPGGQPNYLIVSAGSTPNASLTNTHLPSFIGSVDFFFTAAGVHANTDLVTADFTGFKFSFGTAPEDSLATANHETHVPPVGPGDSSVPEPATLAMALTGLIPLGIAGLRRNRRRTTA